MSRRKTKYTMRPDGLIVISKVIEGRRRYFYGRTDKEAEDKLDACLARLNQQNTQSKRPFEEVAADWWEEKEPTLSPNSLTSYQARLKEVKAEFGKTPVDEISAQQIIQWLKRIAAQGYAQKGITNRRSMVKSILDYALASGEIKTNPCTALPIVKGKAPKKRRPASDEDVERIEAAKTSSLIGRMYYFMEYSGCRVGEAVVLQERDIDREHHKATVCKDISFKGQTPIVKDRPKTEAGEREIDLYDNVLEILPKYNDPETYVFFPDGLPTKYQLEKALRTYQRSRKYRHDAGRIHRDRAPAQRKSQRQGQRLYHGATLEQESTGVPEMRQQVHAEPGRAQIHILSRLRMYVAGDVVRNPQSVGIAWFYRSSSLLSRTIERPSEISAKR